MHHNTIIALSGRIGSGKSTMAANIWGFHPDSCELLSTSKHLRGVTQREGREGLQEAGHDMDAMDPCWINKLITRRKWVTVVDSVRTINQINALRKLSGSRVVHVYLDVEWGEIELKRPGASMYETDPCETDENQNLLRGCADVVIKGYSGQYRGAAALGLDDRVDVLIGGQFGSEGKGHIASYLCREYDTVVRSGGPNAGHKVKFDGDKVFTFFHIPSAAIHNPRAMCYIAPSAMLNPTKLLKEISDLRDARGGAHPALVIHPDAFIIEPEDIALEEASVKGSIGSTAQGVGAAQARRVMRPKEYRTAKDIPELKPYVDEVDIVNRRGRKLLEGTQGYGLDLYQGHYPYCTSRATGVQGLLAELGIPGVNQVWGVFRTHPIRVQSPQGGTSGPMESEIELERIHRKSGIPMDELSTTETTSTTFRQRRISEFDWAWFNKSRRQNGITHIALTFADYFGVENRDATSLDELNEVASAFIKAMGIVPDLVSCGFDHKYIIDGR